MKGASVKEGSMSSPHARPVWQLLTFHTFVSRMLMAMNLLCPKDVVRSELRLVPSSVYFARARIKGPALA